ncbi:DUF1028 domain-containing protein [bacterium]|nr:DUF1028 domain-containing protein [bacterium]
MAVFFCMNRAAAADPGNLQAENCVSTFSIVARDPDAGELGVAVASRFFAVGSVVPWARAGSGAVATQSYANTSFGWRGLDLLDRGATPDEAVQILIRDDEGRESRQFGIVAASGQSATYTGSQCLDWAGGRSGENYAVQGNILTGESVVTAMETTFLNTAGSLAERLYAALLAGDAQGGDSRGRQSAALLVVRDKAGYGGYTDRAIDIRVDDHAEPFKELGRLLVIARMGDSWNQAWTLFQNKQFQKALQPMESAAGLAPDNAEVFYDLAVIRLAARDTAGAFVALEQALRLNPKLRIQARKDEDLKALRSHPEFERITE